MAVLNNPGGSLAVLNARAAVTSALGGNPGTGPLSNSVGKHEGLNCDELRDDIKQHEAEAAALSAAYDACQEMGTEKCPETALSLLHAMWLAEHGQSIDAQRIWARLCFKTHGPA